MIIDSHTHLFTPDIVAKVSANRDLVAALGLQTGRALRRMGTASLVSEATAGGVDACLLLPVANENNVERVNTSFRAVTQGNAHLVPAGSLHPRFSGNREELDTLRSHGTRTIKLCSFSQEFSTDAVETIRLLDLISDANGRDLSPFFVLIDTFCKADRYFGTPAAYLTTPHRLGRLVAAYPDIVFVAAHMGGLGAACDEVLRHLPPRPNLYLETSNGAHTFTPDEFCRIAAAHGPDRIVFGTDWPWFGQAEEIDTVDALLARAGFSVRERARVFGGNMAALLGIGINS